MTQQPTETPPGESSTGMVRSEHANDANSGPVSGNRTPMVVTIVAMAVLVLCMLAVVVFGIAHVFS
ncbi:MAG TPA: hypothetical protein VFQ85_14645 [Mycobacteriales bacterium]|nr:hypothetical protein [Mycobacteriales bacterium]